MNQASEAKKNFTKFYWRVQMALSILRCSKDAAPLARRRDRLNLLACYRELSTAKPHRDLVRAVPSACFAHPIRIGSPPTAVDVISIGTTVVRHGDNQHPVAIDVDVTRGRPTPKEVHRLQAVHFVTMRVQRDLHRRRCWCWSGSSSRAWTGRFDSGRGTSAGTAAGHEPACVKQASGRAALVTDVVLRPGAPRIGARVVDPHLLVDRQTQAADNP